MNHPASKLKRADIAPLTTRVIHRGRGFQSSVFLVEIDGQRAAIKDYADAPKWFRNFVAPLLLRREEKALRALDGVECVPRFYGRPDARSMAMEFLPGTPMDTFGKGTLAPEVFPRVQAAIDAIHARKVSHCDLKRRSNLLLSPTGEIYLIDFAAAVVGGKKFAPFSNWLQTQMALIDDKSAPRLKKFVAPELLTDADRAKLDNPTPLEKWAKKLLGR